MIDIATIEAALVGYQSQLDTITAKMAEVQRALGGKRAMKGGGDIPTPFAKPRKKRVLSASARKRIGDAQKKRWAEFHKAKAAPAKKRTMSAAGRKSIAEATRKRWAAVRAAKAATEQ